MSNPFPGSTLTLQFAASAKGGEFMLSNTNLRVSLSTGDSWNVSLDTTMTYYKFTFNTGFNTNSITLYLGGNNPGGAGIHTESYVYVNDWSILINPVAIMMEGNLQLVNGTIQSNDVLLNGTSLLTTLDNKCDIIYVDNKVASLVNSSPSTLDTLNELAPALGNDPNCATTMTNTLALKSTKSKSNIHRHSLRS